MCTSSIRGIVGVPPQCAVFAVKTARFGMQHLSLLDLAFAAGARQRPAAESDDELFDDEPKVPMIVLYGDSQLACDLAQTELEVQTPLGELTIQSSSIMEMAREDDSSTGEFSFTLADAEEKQVVGRLRADVLPIQFRGQRWDISYSSCGAISTTDRRRPSGDALASAWGRAGRRQIGAESTGTAAETSCRTSSSRDAKTNVAFN